MKRRALEAARLVQIDGLMDRKPSDGLRKNPDASIDCSHLHGVSFIDGFAGIASTKEKAIGTAISAVGGLVS